MKTVGLATFNSVEIVVESERFPTPPPPARKQIVAAVVFRVMPVTEVMIKTKLLQLAFDPKVETNRALTVGKSRRRFAKMTGEQKVLKTLALI